MRELKVLKINQQEHYSYPSIKYFIIVAILFLALIGCREKVMPNDSLIKFNVKYLKEINRNDLLKYHERNLLDKPMNLTTTKNADTLNINFEVIEPGAEEALGDIHINKDTLVIKRFNKSLNREYGLYNYHYQIIVPNDKNYKLKIEDNNTF